MGIKQFLCVLYDKTRINLYWLFFKLFIYKPRVLSPEETIDLIKKNNLSVSRFGDGEFRLMIQKGEIGFQKANENLSKELISSFNVRDENLIICSFDFNNKWKMNNPAGRWLKSFVFYKYKDIKKLFDKKYTYGNTDITRFYNPHFFGHTNFEYLENEYIPLLKSIWDNKNILIVEGEQTKLGIGNDLFDNCASIRRIICPAVNAFDKYQEIYNSIIVNRKKDELVLLALGPTASVLVTNLTQKEKIQCIDIGHVDVVYMWFLNKSSKPDSIENKYVNESVSGCKSIPCTFSERELEEQIIDKIL